MAERATKAEICHHLLSTRAENRQKARERQTAAGLLRAEAKLCAAGWTTVSQGGSLTRMEEREKDRVLQREKNATLPVIVSINLCGLQHRREWYCGVG